MVTTVKKRKAEGNDVKYFPMKEGNGKLSYIIKDGRAGVVNEAGKILIEPKFHVIERDSSGNYICTGMAGNKSYCEVYDAKFKRIK